MRNNKIFTGDCFLEIKTILSMMTALKLDGKSTHGVRVCMPKEDQNK